MTAEQGDDDAQNNLGVMYASGTGVSQDKVEAYVWFSLAVENGNNEAARNRARLLLVRGSMLQGQAMTRKRLEENPELLSKQ